MIKKIGFVLMLFTAYISSPAQFKGPYEFNVAVPDSSNNSFFENNPKFSQIHIVYYNYKPASLYFYRKADSSEYKKIRLQFIRTESYDLGFIGDTYLLGSKYKGINFPKIPNSFVDAAAKSLKCQQGAVIVNPGVFINKDTIHYHSHQQCDKNATDVSFMPVGGIGSPPLPKYGESTKIKQAIEKNCSLVAKLGDMDSTLVFWGKVSKLGILDSLALKAGNRSVFSDCVKKQIEDPGNKWAAAEVNDLHVFDTYIRIYVKLNKDKTIDLVFGSKLLAVDGR